MPVVDGRLKRFCERDLRAAFARHAQAVSVEIATMTFALVADW